MKYPLGFPDKGKLIVPNVADGGEAVGVVLVRFRARFRTVGTLFGIGGDTRPV